MAAPWPHCSSLITAQHQAQVATVGRTFTVFCIFVLKPHMDQAFTLEIP